MKLGFELTLKTFGYLRMKFINCTGYMLFFVPKIERVFVYIVVDKIRLAVSRRLGPFPKLLRGKMDQVGW